MFPRLITYVTEGRSNQKLTSKPSWWFDIAIYMLQKLLVDTLPVLHLVIFLHWFWSRVFNCGFICTLYSHLGIWQASLEVWLRVSCMEAMLRDLALFLGLFPVTACATLVHTWLGTPCLARMFWHPGFRTPAVQLYATHLTLRQVILPFFELTSSGWPVKFRAMVSELTLISAFACHSLFRLCSDLYFLLLPWSIIAIKWYV